MDHAITIFDVLIFVGAGIGLLAVGFVVFVVLSLISDDWNH